MARSINTSAFPIFPQHIPDDAELVALGSSVPRSSHVNYRSLSSIARGLVARNGISIVDRTYGRHLLKKAIFRIAGDADIGSFHSRISSSVDIILRTGIDAQLLAARGSQRVRQLGLITAEYQKALRRQRLIASSELLIEASRLVTEKRKIVVYGHFRARMEELLLIDALADEGSVYYLPLGNGLMFEVNIAAVKQLEENGWEVLKSDSAIAPRPGARAAAKFADRASHDPQITPLAFPDLDKEVRSILAAVKQLVRQGAPPERIAVVARDMKRYARPITVIADEYGLPIQLDHSIPLETTGFGGFVMTLLKTIDSDFAFEPTARMIMHPFGPGLGERRIAEARRGRVAGREQWLGFCPSIECLYDKGEKPLSDWTQGLRSAAEILGSRARAVASTVEWLAYQTFFDAWKAASRFEADRSINYEVFSAIVGEILKEEVVRMRPRRGGVRVLLPEDMVGASYDQVYVMGLAEGVFPRPPKDDPVVDFFERRSLREEHSIHFASASQLAHWEELSFYFTLLSAEKRIVLSYPRLMDNAELVPGAFFKRLGIDEEKLAVVREPKIISSVEEARQLMLRQPVLAFDKGLESARQHYRAELARETNPIYDEYDGVIGDPIDPSRRTWSASQITVIGQCSFRWFAGRLLHLNAVEEMKTGLDGGTRGRLYHKALEIAVSRSMAAPDVLKATLDNLDEAFADAEKDEKVNLPVLPNWDVERREQLRELRKAVEAADFIMPEANVVGVEREFRAEWEGFPLRGTIDRIDETPAGLIAIDYKTSGQVPKGAKDPNGKLSVDVQIPIYSRVALPRLFPGRPVGTSVYYSLTKGKVLRSEQEQDIAKLTDLAAFLRYILEKGSFAVDPDLQEKACLYCDFETVCRKGPRLRRKQRSQ
jgi:RecB family exonuclease